MELKFSDAFIELALEEKKYTKIDLNIQTQLKSKYSLILYEIIIDYTNQYNKFLTIPHLDINTFKSLMGFSDKYISKAHIKRDILDKAKNDLEKVLNINIDYEFIVKSGIDFIKILFSYDKTKILKKQLKKPLTEEHINDKQTINRLCEVSVRDKAYIKKLEKDLSFQKYKNEQLVDYMDGIHQESEEKDF